MEITPHDQFSSIDMTLTPANRYSEFDQLRQKLVQTFPNSAAAMPQLPPKSIICTVQCRPSLYTSHLLTFRNSQIPAELLGEAKNGSCILFEVRLPMVASHIASLTLRISCVLLNPEFSGSPVLKEFVFE